MAFEHLVTHLAARQQLGQRMAHELADPERALGGASIMTRGLMSCHLAFSGVGPET